ncbi:MAG: DUF7718 family protein, partial [Terriglobales bacterium]
FRASVPRNNTGEFILSTAIEQLADNCRLSTSKVERMSVTITRVQLEVHKDERWVAILTYELAEQGSVRYEWSPTGAPRSMKFDLPLVLAQDMMANDLSTNWTAYCKRFLAGKRLSA